MSATAIRRPQRRGACPGLSAPMPTGDGLLARLLPAGTMPLAAFIALCEAARAHGNGVIEITSRGSIQVRGLSETSAPPFSDAIAALDIETADGVPVLCGPLAGLDAEEIFDATLLARDLRQQIAQRALAARLSPKVSIVIDGGGTIGLDTVAGDIRLRAARRHGDVVFDISAGGDAAHALNFGEIASAHGVEAGVRLLDVIAKHGCEARARDMLAAAGAPAFSSAIQALLVARPCESGDPELDSRLRGNEWNIPIGAFALRDGTAAVGIGLAFGHADSRALKQLVDAAETAGAVGLRTAPGRALLAIGLTRDSAPAFAARAQALGFITRAGDPRRKVVACAGAPICASAHIASRALAPVIAADVAEHFAGTIHVSGCAKGCAHAARAPLTVVGTAEGCALIENGSVRDAPFAVVAEHELRVAVRNRVREHVKETAHV